MRHVDRLLRPGGLVYFSEHVGFPRGSWRRALQDAAQPWWGLVSDGCHCNRDTLSTLAAVPGWHVTAWAYSPGGPPLLGPFLVGLAAKAPAPTA